MRQLVILKKKQLPLVESLKAITLDVRRTQSSSRSVIKINKKKYDMVEWWIVRNFGLCFFAFETEELASEEENCDADWRHTTKTNTQ